jgi:uncharacterized protein with von Willebrand factor type A (vWA) domain
MTIATEAILTAGAIAAALAAVGVVLRLTWRIYRRFDAFFDDWFGQPPRAGRGAVPGIPERVHQLEQALDTVRRQVTPNGGRSSSLGDRAVRIEQALGTDPNTKEHP